MKNTMVNAVISGLGSTALISYWYSKLGIVRDAANMLVMDIKRGEAVVRRIRELKTVEQTQNTILHVNNWMKYRHLFVSKLSYDEVVAFNSFFDDCIVIDEEKKRIDTILDAGLVAKATIIQQKIFSIEDLPDVARQEKKDKYISEVDNERHLFNPRNPYDTIFGNIDHFVPLSNTPAFNKLKKIADRPRYLPWF